MREYEIDWTDKIKKLEADDKAGYPPNCKEGYVAKDGKCVPIEENEAKKDKKENPFKVTENHTLIPENSPIHFL